MEGFFQSDTGSVHVHPSIVREVIWPELIASKKFLPRNANPNDRDARSLRRHLDRTVTVQFDQGRVLATLSVQVEYGTSIKTEANRLRERIVRAVEAITGLGVAEVTINVEKVFPKTDA